MLDIQFIRDNAELVKQKSQQKQLPVDIDRLLQLDNQRRQLLSQIEELRHQRNELASTGQPPSEDQISRGRELKDQLAKLEDQVGATAEEFENLLKQVPNTMPDDTPLGGEEANREEKSWGERRTDTVQDHLSWGESHQLIDFERGAKVSGNKFYFLKGPLVELELAIFRLGLDAATKHGFMPMTVPHLVNTRVTEGTGFMPRGDERQIYNVEGEDLNLIATAEIPLAGYHADEILALDQLPRLYAGLSPAYRMEAGAYGKHSRGLYRVHQFNKLELYVFCRPDDSEDWHHKLVAIEEELCQLLEIPYRLVRIAAGDLGAPAYKKYDIEYWSPADQAYHELMSCSNTTDYQTRRLNIRYRDERGDVHYVHTLNGTAAAFSRVAIALIENFQTADGRIKLPAALRPYMREREHL